MTTPAAPVLVRLRCTAYRPKYQRRCDALVVKLPSDLWERAVADEVEVVCPTCRSIYKLGDWR